MVSVLIRRSTCLRRSTRSLSDVAKKWEESLKDPFLQPIDRPHCLEQFPDFTVLGPCTQKLRVSNKDRFAVIQLGSHQFKVTNEDVIFTEKIPSLSVNQEIRLQKVLVWASLDQTVIGRPFIPNAYVHALVEEQCEDAPVIIFKKKRRKRYKRTTQHTQELTGVRIIRICDLQELLNQSEKDSAKARL